MRIALLTVLLCLVAAPAALAQGQLTAAADGLRSDPIYVDPDARDLLPAADVRDLRREVREKDAFPLYIAVLPAGSADEAGGNPDVAAREIAFSVGEPGVYATIIGKSFSAGEFGDDVLGDEGPQTLAAQAIERAGPSADAVLTEFVGLVGQARQNGGSTEAPGDDEGTNFPPILLILIAVPVVLFAVSRVRRSRREREDFERVTALAREDQVALGDDIRALDLDVEMPDVDPEAKQHYGLAVERYEAAGRALADARKAADVEQVSSLLEEGRWAMLAAKARFAGEPVPERRSPCFFDPRHGPSVKDVEWAPDGGEPRPVPVCAADAERLAEGEEPRARSVRVGGRDVPYWEAGPGVTHWAGGYYGSGLIPALFVGSMVGGSFGFPGDAAGAGDSGGGGLFGDFGGGDYGGGGFGGGDFGGGGGDGGGGG